MSRSPGSTAVLLAVAGLLAIAFERGCSKGESGSDDDTDE
jgi:hypothetical protein